MERTVGVPSVRNEWQGTIEKIYINKNTRAWYRIMRLDQTGRKVVEFDGKENS